MAEVRATDPPERGAVTTAASSRTWRGLWALGFVGVLLVALVAVPAFIGSRVAEVQARATNTLEPAARLSSSLSLIQSRQMAWMDGYLLTGDLLPFGGPYIAAITEKDSMVAELRALSSDIDIEVFERVAELFNDWARWDFENTEIFGDPPTEAARVQIRAQFDDLQQATAELDRAIRSHAEDGYREIEALRTLQNRITFALALIALFGMAIVGRIGYRYRALTLEGESRRREAVRARREIDALLEATGDGVLGIDLEGRCTSLNPAGSKLLGYTEREIGGRDVHGTLFHSEADGRAVPRDASPVLAALAAGRPLDSGDGAVLWGRRRVPFPARWSLRPLVDGTELRGAVLTFTDMTEIREKEEALRRAIRQREDVVSIVSHDLRNPLGVVMAAADLLIDLPLEEEQRRRQAEIILRSSRRMQRLIEDLLDVARIEAGVLVVRPSLEELAPILEEARELFLDPAEGKGIELVVEPGGEGLAARVDRDRVMQALANLLDNAVRLTPEGGRVALSVEDRGTRLAVSVADDGPGIHPDLLGHLFDRFAQADGPGRGEAGLGLTIVEGVAHAHGGTVEVDSRLDEGSTFTLLLPKEGPDAGGEGTHVG